MHSCPKRFYNKVEMIKISYWKLMAYIELMKPELTSLSVLTTACSFYLAGNGQETFSALFSLAVGTLLVGGGAGALNEYLEHEYDALMRRTEKRPIPSGRILPFSALIFGSISAFFGLAVLAWFNNLLSAVVAGLTLVTYLLVYTPLKRVTWWNTLVGAVPGALPTLIGWAAARNTIDIGGWVLFAILFAWQIPHFLSLAWMFRKDYGRAGFRMLPVVDDDGKRTSYLILVSTLALFPIIVLSVLVGLAGWLYLVSALLLSLVFLGYAALFRKMTHGSVQRIKANLYSRKLFFASLLYLPALMVMMTVDKV